MHQISQHLGEFDCWFSQVFADSPLLKTSIKYTPFLDGSVLAPHFKIKTESYLRQYGLKIDYQGVKNKYDLVVYCTDLVIAKKFNNTKTIWVQEGMIDKWTGLSSLIKTMGLPTYFCGDTSLNGSTNICDIYCTASEGYKNYLSEKGTDPAKLFVTGIPNYDNHVQFLENDFPYHDYVMVATTDMRETYRFENRPEFIKKAVKIADGRQMLFKLHPNEKVARAEAEIKKYAPAGSLIFSSGNTSHMIANCCELVTQYSTVVYTGIALGKKVHSYFKLEDLKKLAPIQNGGASAKNIARICSSYVKFAGKKEDFLKQFIFKPEVLKVPEMLYA